MDDWSQQLYRSFPKVNNASAFFEHEEEHDDLRCIQNTCHEENDSDTPNKNNDQDHNQKPQQRNHQIPDR